jgi:hypothetical protein
LDSEVIEVLEDSDDVKKWPLWTPKGEDTASESSVAGAPEAQPENAPLTVPSEHAIPLSSAIARPEQPLPKKPGPRKSKTKLGPLPEPTKPKKLTTLDKSAMDWKAHVSSARDPSLKHDLDANRREGGYLEKVAFLQRVEERKDQAFDANKPNKRRR